MAVSNLVKRTISIIILAPLFILALLYCKVPLILTMTTLMELEWFKINKKKGTLLYILGILYILIPMLFSLKIPDLLNILIIVWTCDIFAYIGGRVIGGPKLAPTISPKKTWSGAISGIMMSVIVSSIFLSSNYISIFLMAIGTVIGDLIESKAKRVLNIKDSGSLIPGHGGILDRFDGFLGGIWVKLIIAML